MMTRPRAVSDWLMRQASLKCSPVAPDALFRSEPAFHSKALTLELTGSLPVDLYSSWALLEEPNRDCACGQPRPVLCQMYMRPGPRVPEVPAGWHLLPLGLLCQHGA